MTRPYSARCRTTRSCEDIQYHISVQQKIVRGLHAAEQGNFISAAEIEQRIARWAGE